MATYTGSNGVIKADLTALRAITSTDLPASGAGFVALFVAAENDWFEYNPDLSSGDVRPIDNPSTGWWIRIGKDILRANRNYFVRTDGSDSNNGLANTSGGAFLTIQKAFDVVKQLDLNGQTVTITCIGDFTGQGTINVFLPIGAGDVILQGDTSSITATKIRQINMSGQKAQCRFIVDALEIINTAANSSCLGISNSIFYHGRISYVTGASGFPLNVASGSLVLPSPSSSSINFTVSGGATNVLGICSNNSLLQLQGLTGNITINGSPTFILGQWYVEGASYVNLGGVTITGAFSGTQYVTVASSNSTIRRPNFSYQSST